MAEDVQQRIEHVLRQALYDYSDTKGTADFAQYLARAVMSVVTEDDWEYGLPNDATSAFVISPERAEHYRHIGEPTVRRRPAGPWEPVSRPYLPSKVSSRDPATNGY